MAQHAIPQQISSYEFKLVGEMTLKQFFKAAGGIVIALMINASKVGVLIRWPLMLIFAGGGLAFAFLPFSDRSLETWIWLFFKAIYKPTIYIYRKKWTKDRAVDVVMTPTISDRTERLEGSRVRMINQKGIIKDLIDNIPTIKFIQKDAKEEDGNNLMNKAKTFELDAEKIAKELTIEEEEKLKVQKTNENDWRNQDAKLNLQKQKLGATGEAVFGEIPMPDIPDIPNIIVGMVTNEKGKIVEGAIVEIQDEQGNPNRVLKTNSLGQFKTSSPLINGKYLIICEKEDYNFDRVNVDLNGLIVKPIKISSNV